MSTETSQLARISRHLAPQAAKQLNVPSSVQIGTEQHGLYFQPNDYQMTNQSPFKLVIPDATHQIDSRTNGLHTRVMGRDTPKSGHEVLEIAQLHERYNRQSSEEDIIALETFVGKLLYCVL